VSYISTIQTLMAKQGLEKWGGNREKRFGTSKLLLLYI
jgi:hypothetical protein